MSYRRKTETAYIKHGKGFARVLVVAHYPEVKAARIIVGEHGDEMIVRESELLPTKPETDAEKRRRLYNQSLAEMFKAALVEPKSISVIAKERGAWPIQIAAWLLKLERFSWVKRVDGNKWEWKGV